MTDINELTPAIATHPGEVLKDELKARRMTTTQLAVVTAMPRVYIKRIITGREPILAVVALKLEKALGIDAVVWLNLQQNYLIDVAKIMFRQECDMLWQLKKRPKLFK